MYKFFTMTTLIASILAINHGYGMDEPTPDWVIDDENHTAAGEQNERHPFEADQEVYDRLEMEKGAEINKKIDELLDRLDEEELEEVANEMDRRCQESNVSDENALREIAAEVDADFQNSPTEELTDPSMPEVQERGINLFGRGHRRHHRHCRHSAEDRAAAAIAELAIIVIIAVGIGVYKGIKWIIMKIRERIEKRRKAQAQKTNCNVPKPVNTQNDGKKAQTQQINCNVSEPIIGQRVEVVNQNEPEPVSVQVVEVVDQQ